MVFGAQGGILGYQGDFYYAVIFLHPPGAYGQAHNLWLFEGSRKKSNPNKKGHEIRRIPR